MDQKGRRKGRWRGGAVLVLIGALVTWNGLQAEGGPIDDALTDGGDRLECTQNSDGGWASTVPVGFPCPGPSAPSAFNTFGIVGLGLLSAYERTGDPLLRAAALETGNALVGKFNIALRGDKNPATDADRPFPQDVEFLTRLAQLLENEAKALRGSERRNLQRQARTFSSAASSWFKRTTDDFRRGSVLVGHFIDGRDDQGLRSLAAWDGASAIRAARAVGSTRFAEEMVAALLARAGEWRDTDSDHQFGQGPPDNPFSFDFTVLGSGSLMSAFRAFGKDEIGRGSNLINLRDEIFDRWGFLLENQGGDGSWLLGNTQTTAYALLGLNGEIDRLAKEIEELEGALPNLGDVDDLEIRVGNIRDKVGEIKEDAISRGRLTSSNSTVRELSEIDRVFKSITRSLSGRSQGLSRQTRLIGSKMDREIKIIANPRTSAAAKVAAESRLARLIEDLVAALRGEFRTLIGAPLAELLERLVALRADKDNLEEAVAKAAGFLVCSQLPNGGFLAPSPLPGETDTREEFEINSEVLQGLAPVTAEIGSCSRAPAKNGLASLAFGVPAAPMR